MVNVQSNISSRLSTKSTKLYFSILPDIMHACVLSVCMHVYVCEVCPVPEAEINMKSVAIFTQINLHTADSQFHRAVVCECVYVCLGSCYVHTIQLSPKDWKKQFLLTRSIETYTNTRPQTLTQMIYHDKLDTCIIAHVLIKSFRSACVYVHCVFNSWIKAAVVVGQLILRFAPSGLPFMHIFD